MTYYSLQVGPKAGQVAALRDGQAPVVDLSGALHSWIDTANAIAELDLVIGVDTGVVHLTGALGKPAWLLLGVSPDWRWMLERDDSPWYPTLRLYRHPERGDWPSVINRVREDLTVGVG